jgi:hypothetical protein
VTKGSMPSTHNSSQDLALQLRLSQHVRRIATELYRFDKRSDSAQLEELAEEHQQTYIKAATAAAFLSDQERLRPALYDAADILASGGLASLTRPQRAQVVKTFIRAFQVMRDHLCGLRHPDTAELMRTLSEKDASISNAGPAAPVADAGIDLANLETTTGVM